MTFDEAMRHRFACRSYLDKPISDEVLSRILDYGRLTPSSFGWEGWKFLVVKGDRRGALCRACFGQACVESAPLSVVIVSRRGRLFDPDGPFISSRAERTWDKQAAIEDFRGFYESLKERGVLDEWARSQGYLAAANMATGAKTLGVDSVILEGFDEKSVLEVVALDAKDWLVSLVIPFGYAAAEETPKLRLPLSDLVETLN